MDDIEEGEVEEEQQFNEDNTDEFLYLRQDAFFIFNSEREGDEEEDKDEEWRLNASLPVAPIDAKFDPQATPNNGEEYLRLVQYQSKMLPFAINALVTKNVDAPEISDTQDTTNLPEDEIKLESTNEYLCKKSNQKRPSQEFIDSFMETFLKGCTTDNYNDNDADTDQDGTLENSYCYPKLGDEENWHYLLYRSYRSKRPKTQDQTRNIPTINPDNFLNNPPSQRQLLQLIKFHIQWIGQEEEQYISERCYQFIIRILQCLDPRMTSWQQQKLRSLALYLQSIAMDHKSEEQIFFIQGITTAIAYRFGQLDLLS